MLPGTVGADVTSSYIAPSKVGSLKSAVILHDQMDLQRRLPFPLDEGGDDSSA